MKKVCLFLLIFSSAFVFSCDEDLRMPYFEPGSEIIRHTGYVAKYSEAHELAEWVAYQLTREEVEAEVAERTEDFREDPAVSTGTATKKDYKSSGYERGHLAPAEDFDWSEDAMSGTFYFTNVAPQKGGFNRGIWLRLENRVRAWALENDEIYVVTGPVLTDGPYETIGDNQVAVPKRFYKVILDYKEPETKAIGFILRHEPSGEALGTFAVSIDEVERVTGLDFFHLLPDELEESLEAPLKAGLWPGLR